MVSDDRVFSMASASAFVPTPGSSISSSPNVQHHLFIKLQSDNYLLWTTQLLPLLRSYDLIGFVGGTKPSPSPTITTTTATPTSPSENSAPPTITILPNPSYEDWIRKDQMVLSWLISSLSPEVLPYVVGLNSAAVVWWALRSAFGTLSHTSILQLHMQLQGMVKGNKTVSEYLREVKYISNWQHPINHFL